jgi:hypothetical protein
LALGVCSGAFVRQASAVLSYSEVMEDNVAMERRKDVSWIGEPKSGLHGQSATDARPAVENAIR